ncbi:MAG: hypothetical protein Pg6B_05460 [Candidatus Azobacteroides pseudotrichonymphae]|jgi:hypothetical protein|nr:MAG: hypothetical protein Pg6B_05460 [Candidatus Azobacteroides pseudotrichonymphae]
MQFCIVYDIIKASLIKFFLKKGRECNDFSMSLDTELLGNHFLP